MSLVTGCAWNAPRFREETRGTNGLVTIRELRVPTWALWPATTELSRQKASLGKTFSLGTDGLREDSGGTNVVEGLKALGGILDKLRP